MMIKWAFSYNKCECAKYTVTIFKCTKTFQTKLNKKLCKLVWSLYLNKKLIIYTYLFLKKVIN